MKLANVVLGGSEARPWTAWLVTLFEVTVVLALLLTRD